MLKAIPIQNSEVNRQINNLIDAAPAQLNTLNELATALNDDSNFATTITNIIATKQPLLNNTAGWDQRFLMTMIIA